MDRYDDRISGVPSCDDRDGDHRDRATRVLLWRPMTRYLYANGIRIFDYPQFAMELRDRVRDGAASLAAEAGITIEHITKSHIRKEAIAARVLEQRGEHPGPVHILSAMEACEQLPALARQGNRQDVRATGQR